MVWCQSQPQSLSSRGGGGAAQAAGRSGGRTSAFSQVGQGDRGSKRSLNPPCGRFSPQLLDEAHHTAAEGNRLYSVYRLNSIPSRDILRSMSDPMSGHPSPVGVKFTITVADWPTLRSCSWGQGTQARAAAPSVSPISPSHPSSL